MDNTSSHMAERMGARITLSGPDRGMYLVITSDVSAVNTVQRYNGTAVLNLTPVTCLALLSFEGYLLMKKDPGVKKIGPVSVDIERFNRSLETLAGKGTTA